MALIHRDYSGSWSPSQKEAYLSKVMKLGFASTMQEIKSLKKVIKKGTHVHNERLCLDEKTLASYKLSAIIVWLEAKSHSLSI